MATFTEYTTIQGDRWDLIAYKAYGDVNRVPQIVEANPYVAVTPTLPAGIKLRIPVVTEEGLDANLLPPWKR
jgi:phage tail protein X